MMRRNLILLAVLVMMPFALSAQSPEHPRRGDKRHNFNFEEFLDMKCSTVVQTLGLNAQDSIRFVPVYRELQRAKTQLFHKYGGGRRVRRAVEAGETVADTTLMRIINNQAQLAIEDAQLEQQYIAQFARILTPLQLYRLQQAEQKFKTDMMKRSKPAKK